MGLYDVEQRVMNELFSKFDPGGFVGLVALVGGLVCVLVAIVMGIVMRSRLQFRLAELAFDFKKEMLERGMTPEEIRILVDPWYALPGGVHAAQGQFQSEQHTMEASSNDSQRHWKSPVEAEV
jgi:hypothetical protein